MSRYTFEISLSVLNHLGRNLYRNFITVLGEGISNSWDAGANNIWISIDRGSGNFVIKDDGDGMTENDFQNKFLRVGYSKRRRGGMVSGEGRPYIGAKGIGKLALLSCADRISIISKKNDTDYVGGVIDNSGLNDAIENEMTPDQYPLEVVDMGLFEPYIEKHEKGTIIIFENTKENIRNTVPYLKKLIALHFKFSLIDANFNIYVQNELVTPADLQGVADSTEFLWNINNHEDIYISDHLNSLKESEGLELGTTTASGFIASVKKPSNLKIAGSEEKAGVDLFVNGRLREKDILKHMPDFSTRIVASYLYGQIHFDDLDSDINDQVFTSSREGVVGDNELYKNLLVLFKEEILGHISHQWDSWRLDHGKVGDEENPQKGKKERYARDLFNVTAEGYKQTGGGVNDRINSLKEEAEFNIPAYTACFLSENILRKRISDIGSVPANCLNIDPSRKKCRDRNPNTPLAWCQHCKAEKGKESLQMQKLDAGTSIQIRESEEDLLLYMDYNDLAKIIGNSILRAEDKPYRPLRNSVMHTSLLTVEAKTKLNSILDNIAATVKTLS